MKDSNKKSFKPQLHVEDVHKTAIFYRDVLNFTILELSESTNGPKAILERDGFVITFVYGNIQDQLHDQKNKYTGCDLHLFFPSLDEFYENIIRKKVSIIKDIELQLYGNLEFSFVDCNGKNVFVGD